MRAINVVRSLRRTIAAIAEQAPLLGAHLDESVRTGGHCIYLPEPGSALSWTVPADTNQVAGFDGFLTKAERIVPPR